MNTFQPQQPAPPAQPGQPQVLVPDIEFPVNIEQIDNALEQNDKNIVDELSSKFGLTDVSSTFNTFRTKIVDFKTDDISETKIQTLLIKYKSFIYVFFKVNLLMVYISLKLTFIIQQTKHEFSKLELFTQGELANLDLLDNGTPISLKNDAIETGLVSIRDKFGRSTMQQGGGSLFKDIGKTEIKFANEKGNLTSFIDKYINAYDLYRQANDDIAEFVKLIINVIDQYDSQVKALQDKANKIVEERNKINNKLLDGETALRSLMMQKVDNFRNQIDTVIKNALEQLPVNKE
jgi:hypothetical protein